MKKSKIYQLFASSISNKLLLILSCSMFVLLIGVIGVFYFCTVQSLTESTISRQNSILVLVYQRYINYMNELVDYSLDLRRDRNALSLLEQVELSNADRMQLSKLIGNYFSSRNAYGDIEQLEVVLPDTDITFSVTDLNYPLRRTIYSNSMSPESTKRIMSRRGYYDINYTYSDNKNIILLQRAILGFAGRNPLCYVNIKVSDTYMINLLADLLVKEGSVILIYNQDELFYASSELGIAPNGPSFFESNKSVSIDNETYYAFTANDSSSNWQIVKLLPTQTIIADQVKIRNLSIMVGLTLWILSFIIISAIIRRSILRLEKLTQNMQSFDISHNISVTILPGTDEISRLSVSFQNMAEEIQHRIDHEYKLEIIKQKAIVEMLRAQIDPHFLYNSLQTISTQALLAGADDAADTISKLATVFRYNIKGKDPVLLAEELKNATNYVALYKARFSERLEVLWDIDETLIQVEVPKLVIIEMLQNSIRYAVETTYIPIHIKISVYKKEKGICISVQDDGPGLPEDVRAFLNSFFSNKSLFDDPQHSGGLSNLFERLRIMYPQKVSVVVENEHGTCITIILHI